MYDMRGRLYATRNTHGEYVNPDDNVRASSRPSSRASTRFSYMTAPEDRGDMLGPVTDPCQSYYSSRDARLSSSEPGRIRPSSTKLQTTQGSMQYPGGVPKERIGLRPQSAAGYAATPENPWGKGYEQCRTPFPHLSPIRSDYKAYKESGEDYANRLQDYDDKATLNATTSNNFVGGTMKGSARYTQDGHEIMVDYAHAANMAGLT